MNLDISTGAPVTRLCKVLPRERPSTYSPNEANVLSACRDFTRRSQIAPT